MSRSNCQANPTNQRPQIVAGITTKRSRTGETRIAVDISVSAKHLRGHDILNQRKMNNSIQCQSTPKKVNYLQKGVSPYPRTFTISQSHPTISEDPIRMVNYDTRHYSRTGPSDNVTPISFPSKLVLTFAATATASLSDTGSAAPCCRLSRLI